MKPDAFSTRYAELTSNRIDICFVSHKNVPKSIVGREGYLMIRKDRGGSRIGEGVVVIYRNDWKISAIDKPEEFEFIWSKMTTRNSEFYIVSVYHPPDPIYNANELLNFMSDSCDHALSCDSNAKFIIAGDVNQLELTDFVSQHTLHQMVKTSTPGHCILALFLTNYPLLWKQAKVFKGLARTDHLAVMLLPVTPAKPQRKRVSFRDVREHRKVDMDIKLAALDWSIFNTLEDPMKASNY